MAAPGAATALDGEGAKLFEAPTAHAAQRTVQSVLALMLTLAVFEGSLFVPGVARLFGVDTFDGAIACGLVILGTILANAAYRIGGFSRLYFWAEYVESGLVAAGYAYLIVASGTPQSFFWLLYLIHLFVIGTTGASVRNGVLFGAVPAAVALSFGLQGQLAGSVVSLIAGAFGVSLYFMVGRSFDELEAIRKRENSLKESLAHRRVTQERDRIARDLHDGVGSQLAGLIWRVRALASSPSISASAGELETLELRLLDTIDEVRDVVHALRREPMSWDECTALIGKRCREMCGDLPFDLRAEGTPDPALLDAVFSDLIRIVFELVRNAARHASASRISVVIEARSEVRVLVTDDGRGFENAVASRSEGGLRNVRKRVESLGGSMDVASDGRGTRIDIALPGRPHMHDQSVANVPAGSAPPLEMASSHAAFRTVQGLLPVLLAMAAFVGSLFIPAVARTLGATPIEGMIVCGTTFIGTAFATIVYRRTGPSTLYLWAEYTESVLGAAAYSYLIYASGSPHSAFWFLYLFHCFAFASAGTNLRNSVLLGAAPTAVALAFALQGQFSAAVASLVAGAFGVMLYLMTAKSFDELEAARRREAKLKAELAELSVAKERDRIARDLHDSVIGQLADMASRARGLASLRELQALERRGLDTVEELRNLVLALRGKSASVVELAEHSEA